MNTKKRAGTRLDYCQYMLSAQINYSLTNFGEHSDEFSYNTGNRYLDGEHIEPRMVWENVKEDIVQMTERHLVFDNTVVDKNFSYKVDLIWRHYRVNAHGDIKGVGITTCVYENPKLEQFWIID